MVTQYFSRVFLVSRQLASTYNVYERGRSIRRKARDNALEQLKAINFVELRGNKLREDR